MEIISWSSIAGLSSAFSGTAIIGYLTWLQIVDSLDDRREIIQDAVVGKKFKSDVDIILVEQEDFLDEPNSTSYRLRKYIPIIRNLEGGTTLSITSERFSIRRYVLEKEDIGEDFSKYLQNVASGDFPEVNFVRPDISTESSGSIEDICIEVDSLDPDSISKTLAELPNFIEYYYDNYPGDIRHTVPEG